MWCNWKPWSDCSTHPCSNGVQKIKKIIHFKPDTSAVYCMDTIDGKRQVFQLSKDGVKKKIFANKTRHRNCECHMNLYQIFSSRCNAKSVDIQCRTCSQEEPVYTAPYSDNELPFCSDISKGMQPSHLYQIIGGSLGAAAFVAILFCLLRFFLVQSNRPSRNANSVRLHCSHNSTNPNVNISLNQVANSTSSDLPPAYKDVVALDQHESPSLHAPFIAVPPFPERQNSLNPENPSADILLPSYQEVITHFPTAAQMQQNVIFDMRQSEPNAGSVFRGAVSQPENRLPSNIAERSN